MYSTLLLLPTPFCFSEVVVAGGLVFKNLVHNLTHCACTQACSYFQSLIASLCLLIKEKSVQMQALQHWVPGPSLSHMYFVFICRPAFWSLTSFSELVIPCTIILKLKASLIKLIKQPRPFQQPELLMYTESRVCVLDVCLCIYVCSLTAMFVHVSTFTP